MCRVRRIWDPYQLATLPGYQSVSDANVREKFEAAWKVKISSKPGLKSVGNAR